MATSEQNTSISQAIIVAAHSETSPIPSVECCSLLPFIDRAAVQHCVESAVRCGVKIVDVIAADGLSRMRELLGDGQRWGVTLRIHSVPGAVNWQRALQTILRDSERDMSERTLLLNCTQLLPDLHQRLQSTDENNVVWLQSGDRHPAAMVADHSTLTKLASDSDYADLSDVSVETWSRHSLAPASCNSLPLLPAKELLVSQQRVLQGEFSILTDHLKCIESGVWIGRNTRLHPTARLQAPVLIGNNSDIDEGANIGPNAVIGSDTIILRNTVAEHCLVMPYTSIGEDLCLNGCLAEPGSIYNTRIDVTLGIADEVLVADLRKNIVPAGLSDGLIRLAAASLWLLLSVPALFYRSWLHVSGRKTKRIIEVMNTPRKSSHLSLSTAVKIARYTTDEEAGEIKSGVNAQWQDLWLRVTPGLRAVMAGRVGLFGTNLRTTDELRSVPSYWADVIGTHRAGLITESLVQYGPVADADQRCICDVWTTVAAKSRFRGSFTLRYLASLLKGPESRDIVTSTSGLAIEQSVVGGKTQRCNSHANLNHTKDGSPNASGRGEKCHI